MICKHLTKRSYQRKAYIYCRSKKEVITFDDCKKCLKFESREYLKVNKPMKKKSNKLAKLEKARKSILIDDMEHCIGHLVFKVSKIPRDDIHEIYGGRNRITSIKNDFTAPLCRQCHENKFIQQWLKEICQKEYEKTHTREEFIKLIGKSYL